MRLVRRPCVSIATRDSDVERWWMRCGLITTPGSGRDDPVADGKSYCFCVRLLLIVVMNDGISSDGWHSKRCLGSDLKDFSLRFVGSRIADTSLLGVFG